MFIHPSYTQLELKPGDNGFLMHICKHNAIIQLTLLYSISDSDSITHKCPCTYQPVSKDFRHYAFKPLISKNVNASYAYSIITFSFIADKGRKYIVPNCLTTLSAPEQALGYTQLFGVFSIRTGLTDTRTALWV